MELTLTRIYKRGGTIGTLCFKEKLICFTIELPWLENKKSISCIPEGTYEIKPRYSVRHGHHLMVMDVWERHNILFHPANNAQKELHGCIAPVLQLTGIGEGIYSKAALERLLAIVTKARQEDEIVKININSNRYEYLRKIQETDPQIF